MPAPIIGKMDWPWGIETNKGVKCAVVNYEAKHHVADEHGSWIGKLDEVVGFFLQLKSA